MKKVIRLLVSVLAIVNIFVGTAFAGIPSPEIYTSVNQESKLCDKNISYSHMIKIYKDIIYSKER